MKKLAAIVLSTYLLLACQPKKNATSEISNPDSTSTQSESEYKPDQEVIDQNVTGDYAYVEKSASGYTYCEFSIQQLDQLSGDLTVTLFANKNDTEYTDPKGSVTYPLQITRQDGGQLQMQPEIADIEDWTQSTQKFPGLDKLFFLDGSGFPIQNLFRKGKTFILAQSGADSIVLKRVKQ
jgi:hypothetical protein